MKEKEVPSETYSPAYSASLARCTARTHTVVTAHLLARQLLAHPYVMLCYVMVGCWSPVPILDAVINTGDLQERRTVVLRSDGGPPWLAQGVCIHMHMLARAFTKSSARFLKRGLRRLGTRFRTPACA